MNSSRSSAAHHLPVLGAVKDASHRYAAALRAVLDDTCAPADWQLQRTTRDRAPRIHDPRKRQEIHKVVDRDRTPSRARQHVRAGDVLVSTVRPERRAIGVVPTWLDGAVCTTGFAVLRPTRVSGLLLAALLRTPFVTEQLLRNNVGIAYPAIEPACLPDVMLPVSQVDCKALGELADRLTKVRAELHTAQSKFDFELNERASAWLGEVPDTAQILEPNPVAKEA